MQGFAFSLVCENLVRICVKKLRAQTHRVAADSESIKRKKKLLPNHETSKIPYIKAKAV
jgi:hypothetical protein